MRRLLATWLYKWAESLDPPEEQEHMTSVCLDPAVIEDYIPHTVESMGDFPSYAAGAPLRQQHFGVYL